MDTETSGLHVDSGARVSVVSVAWRDRASGLLESRAWAFDQGVLDKPVPFSFQTPSLLEVDVNRSEAEWMELTEWLRMQRIVGHNLKYDLLIMNAGHRKWGCGVDLGEQAWWDTMVACSLLWPLHPVALKPTARRLGWNTSEEAGLLKWLGRHKVNGEKRYDLAPWELIGPYATADAELTLMLYEYQVDMIELEDLVDWSVLQREMELMRTLYRMEARGVPFDRTAALAARRQLQIMLEQQAKALPFTPPTQARARKYFFTERKLQPPKVTDKGAASVDTESMRILAKKGIEGAAEYGRYRQIEVSLSNWYDSWPHLVGPDGRIRTSFRQLKQPDDSGRERGTISGRLAVERVNLQSIPHDYQLPEGVESIRAFFRGEVPLWEMDLSQAEMRVAASVARCGKLLRAFEEGLDAHDATTQDMFGIDKDDAQWGALRAVAKRLNFGMLYGAGVTTIQAQIRQFTGQQASEAQVRSWLDQYRRTYPELPRAARRAEETVRARASALGNGYVRLAGGRHRWFRAGEEYRKAFNAVIQGGVAEMMKEAMVQVEQECPGILLLQIHDSLVLETADEVQVYRARDILETVFTKAFKVPFRADVKRWDHAG